MKNNGVLILSHRFDEHASIIQHCLNQEGVRSFYFFSDLFAMRNKMSFSIANQEPGEWLLEDSGEEICSTDVGTVWNRRFVNPVVPDGRFTDAEKKLAVLELSVFSQSMFSSLCLQAKWVNSIEGETRGRSKILQLLAAKSVGLSIPRTIIGNHPGEIRRFVSANDSVCKTFVPHVWSELNQQLATETVPVADTDLPSDDLLQLVPGIYQERVRKRSDVRVCIFGSEYAAIELPLTDNPAGANDFRITPLAERKARLSELPKRIFEQCRLLMDQLGIITGSFDFLIDESGEWIFLEVNSSGQFLWLEHLVPETRILARFLDFLTDSRAFDQYRLKDVISKAVLIDGAAGLNFGN